MWARLRVSNFLPEPLSLAIPDNKTPDNKTPENTPELKKRVIAWGQQQAPERIQTIFDGDVF
jgi:hypothetical protein